MDSVGCFISKNEKQNQQLNSKIFQRISLAACCLAFLVIVLGAYVRLSDAGLGCPDWPGCFGQITAPDEAHEISRARLDFPHLEIDSGKAWKEMLHRYFASTLGLLIIAMAALAWRYRHQPQQQLWLPVFLVGLVIFQGILGMWTVTQLLRPTIVTLHLVTGLLTLSLLFWVLIRHWRPWHKQMSGCLIDPSLRLFARICVLILAFQIFLGGWTSTNYVALHCPDFPTCQGQWLPQTDFSEAFVFFKDPAVNYEGGTLSLEAGVTVHLMHRIGALITSIALIALSIAILMRFQERIIRIQAVSLLGLLLLQVSLGIANVLLLLPIPVAVSHNAVAAALLMNLISINYSLSINNDSPGNAYEHSGA